MSGFPLQQSDRCPSYSSSDRDADADTFTGQIPDPNSHLGRKNPYTGPICTRTWAEDIPPGSKWFVVYRGAALEVFSNYDLANKEQIHQMFGGKLEGFMMKRQHTKRTKTGNSSSKKKQQNTYRIQAEGTRLVSIYTAGSYTQAFTEQELPALAWWGYVAIDRESEVTVERARGSVSSDPMHVAFRGATLKSNNTGELTAIGEALTWIKSTPDTPETRREICSDSSYELDGLDILSGTDCRRAKNGAPIQWGLDTLTAARDQGHIIQFWKVRAHCYDGSRAAE